MHTFENLNIVLTRTPTPTDADANAWVKPKKGRLRTVSALSTAILEYSFRYSEPSLQRHLFL